MKKLFLTFIFAIAMFSCTKNVVIESTTITDSIKVDTIKVDSIKADTVTVGLIK